MLDKKWLECLINTEILKIQDTLKEESKGYKNIENFLKGEVYYNIFKEIGKCCADNIEKSQATSRDFYDHRLHFLDFEKNMLDFNMLSYDNAIIVLPLNGKVLDLCSGDGFYTWMLSRRASQIDAVEINEIQYNLAKRIWNSNNINYILGDIMKFSFEKEKYDMIFIRGSFEHFIEEHQIQICKNILFSLKPDGWFVGDTPKNKNKKNGKQLQAHENEFESIEELKNLFKKTFKEDDICVYELISKVRTTLFWRVQKR
jgi:2-polyprenyl-3-methyl-5-hydroxy-6-metoxy-1,4-benzoquinol methylase